MSTPLENLLASIHPERTLLANQRLASRALNTFPYPGGRVKDWAAFRNCVTCFFRHTEDILLELPQPLPIHPAMDFNRACHLLKKFGPEGFKTAAYMSIHGVEGGLRHVLEVIATELAEECSANEIRARVAAYWNSLTTQEKMDASAEYLTKYARLLPEDIKEGGAPCLHVFFPRFVEKHPGLLRRLGQVGR